MSIVGSRLGFLACLVSLGPIACFSEAGLELPPGCSLGQHLCPCDDEMCDPGLTCSVSAEVCVSLDCEVGALECPCSSGGACNPGLVCGQYDYCVPEDNTATTGDPTVSGSMSDSMSASVTSETMSTTNATTASTTVDPDTSATDVTDATTGSMSTTDSETTESMSTTDSETTASSDPTTDSDPTSTTDPSGSSSGSDTDSACAMMAECSDCLSCAQQDDCDAIWSACTNIQMGIDAACVNGFMSYYTCTAMQNEAQCQNCEGASPLADELFACLADVCGAHCTCL